MDNKMQIYEDLELLVRMCRSKSDGTSLIIEEEEIKNKIKEYDAEIEDIKSTEADENYDTSAEMADRNIEIITKKLISTIKAELKDRNLEMAELKEKEKDASGKLSMLKDSKDSYETYITSMKERVASSNDNDVNSRYNSLISQTEQKIIEIKKELETATVSYGKLQSFISRLADEINKLEKKLSKKQEQLQETQENLKNRDTYIDKVKLEKNNKKINDIESKKKKLKEHLSEIRNDPKYLEAQIKRILSKDEDPFVAREYLNLLINKAMAQPYMNVAADNALEEELLRATQARDTFANEIDQKTYNIMETVNPEQIRIEYLNEKIEMWEKDLASYKEKISSIDKDQQFNYHERMEKIADLIDNMKKELVEFKKAYDNESAANLSSKASLKVAYEEKKADLEEAEKIALSFRKDEAEDIRLSISLLNNECENVKNNISIAQSEIDEINNRLISRKSGMTDIGAQNKDKEHLKELAKVVMDIKHRRQFAETPEAIAKRLEKELGIDLFNESLHNSKRDELDDRVIDFQNESESEDVMKDEKSNDLLVETPELEVNTNEIIQDKSNFNDVIEDDFSNNDVLNEETVIDSDNNSSDILENSSVVDDASTLSDNTLENNLLDDNFVNNELDSYLSSINQSLNQ